MQRRGGTAGAPTDENAAVAPQAASTVEVSSETELNDALNDENISKIVVIKDCTHKGSLEVNKELEINEGVTLTLSSSTDATVSGTGSIVNNGTIKMSSGYKTWRWTTITASGNGKIYAEKTKWNNYQTYVDYGCVPDEMLVGSNCKINIVKDVSVTPVIALPSNVQTGNLVTVEVSNLIQGVDLAEVFTFKWKNNNSDAYDGATNLRPTQPGTLKLNLDTKKPYTIKTSNGEKSYIEYTSTDGGCIVTKRLLDTVYINQNGNNSNSGADADHPVMTFDEAMENVSDNSTIVLTGDYEQNGSTYAALTKNVTVTSPAGSKYTLSFNSVYGIKINSGVTVTFDRVTIENTTLQDNGGNKYNLILKDSDFIVNTGNTQDISGTTKLTLDNSKVTGKFSTQDLEVKRSSELHVKHNAPAVINGNITAEEGAELKLYAPKGYLTTGEKLIEVPASTNENIANNFVLADTQAGKYALKCRKAANNYTYILISERIEASGTLTMEDEIQIGKEIPQHPSYGNEISNVSGIEIGWSGGTGTWAEGDTPVATVTLKAEDNNGFYHFDDSFDLNALTVSTQDGVTLQNKNVSDDGRTLTFEVVYPTISKLTQAITGEVNAIDVTCGRQTVLNVYAQGAKTYRSSAPEVVSVGIDNDSGMMTMNAHKPGTAVITVDAAETDTYGAATKTFTVTVSHQFGEKYKYDGNKHWKECACKEKTEEAEHTGGTADCITQAKCETCGASYGTVDAANHKGTMRYEKDTSSAHKVICDACAAVVSEEEHTFENNECTKCGYKKAVSSSYIPTVQKPSVTTGEGGKTSLENSGSTLLITPDEGMQIAKVTVNGKEVTVTDNKVTGLKSGDKVEVSFEEIPQTKEETEKVFKEKLQQTGFAARSSKTAKKNIRVDVKVNAELKNLLDEMKAAGYTVKYRFYRSDRKSSGYKFRLTKTEGTYFNTVGKEGVNYYYRVKILVYDKDGKLLAQTGLKQCKYGNRIWTKK